MEQRITLITLGVADVARARQFYEALGWQAAGDSTEGMVYFDLGPVRLALFGRGPQARNAGLSDDGATYSGIVLTYYTHRREEIYQLLGQVKAAGGTVLKPADKVAWGGYAGYFADPDGHPWEVAWSPNVPLDSHGHMRRG